MPIIKSAKKKLRQDKKRESDNKRIDALVNFSLKKAEKKSTPKNIQEAFSIIDKAVKKNIIHKNKAARLKSKLSKRTTLPAKAPVRKKKPKNVTK